MHLRQTKFPTMKRVVAHSSLLGTGLSRKDLPEFHDFVRSLLDDDGTLVVPSYTLGKLASPFNPVTSPSIGVGAYSEYVRRLPQSVRSASPLHSHSGIGAEAGLLQKSSIASFGPGSDFELFETHDFWLVLLNTSFAKGATVLHHVEAISGVPYRTTIEIHRMIHEGGETKEVAVRYPARVHHNIQTDFDKIVPILERKAPSFMQVSMPEFGVVSAVKIPELIEIGLSTLESNANFFRVS